ncbi:MAG: fatty acid desaturase CarF family protein [Planctomycetota bacterium]
MLKFIGTFFVCLWVADFITGFAHWLEDTYCLEDYPVIGGFICEPNIEHHIDPHLMVRTGTFFSRNILQWSLCAGAFGLLWLIGLGNIYTFMILLLASFGNEVHRWNHMSKPGPVISFLKDFGIIQAHRQHSMHHKPPHKRYYCVLTSQVNAVLERVNFWRKLEWVVEKTTGISPKREGRRDDRSSGSGKERAKKKAPESTVVVREHLVTGESKISDSVHIN